MGLKHGMHKLAVVCGFLVILAMIVSGCGGNGDKPGKKETAGPAARQYYIFGTVVNIKLYDDAKAQEHLDHIDTMLKTLDEELSRTLESSQLYEVNKEAGKQPVEVSEDTMAVVKRSITYAEESGGLFDPTVGGLVDLWDIGNGGEHVPDPKDLQRELSLVGYKDIVLDEAKQTVFLKRPGMVLDLGGIGKGYAADVVAEYLREEGVTSALVDLGGSSIIVIGSKPNGDNWNIGLQDPDSTRGISVGTIRLNDQVIDTSGIYERYFIENGVMYHHILDPRTGAPAQNNLKSVTILAGNAMDADALSTFVYIMGLEEGLQYIEDLNDNTEAMFITTDDKIYVTSGLKDSFKVSSDQYTLVE
ncbi:Thiamine biosynthesis lipoprotein ApbE precursor [compost metagenome]